MGYTTEALDSGPIPTARTGQSELDMPTKEFVGYDPKGTTTITNTPIQRPNPKQEVITEEPVVTEETVSLPAKVSAIARKEQAQRQREAAFKRKEQELAAKLEDAEKYAQLKSKIANKDFAGAEELGMTYEEYTNFKLKQSETQDPAEQRFIKIQQELAELKKAQEESVNKEYQANQSLWKQEIAKVIAENEEYSTIKALGAEDIVLQHINDSFDEDDVELSVDQAAKEIEAALYGRAEKFSSVPKLKGKIVSEAKVLGPPKTSPKTITQNMTVTSAKSTPKPLHMMSETEQWLEATRRYQAARQQR